MTLQYGGMFEQGNMRYLLSSGNVEDNFNTWTLKWCKVFQDPVLASDLPSGLEYDRFDFFVDDKNDTIHIAWEDTDNKYRYGIFSCTDFSNLMITPGTWSKYDPIAYGSPSIKESFFLGTVEANYGFSQSIQTYVLYVAYEPIGYKEVYLNVVRNASLVWNRSVWDDLPAPQNTIARIVYMGISLTGKYITLTTYCYSGGTYRNILLYEGSYVEP